MVAKPKGLKAGGGERAPWMPFYGRDFYSNVHVRAMSWHQRGLYQFLLWTAWEEGGIPDDAAELAAICNESPRAFAKAWARISQRWRPHPTRPGWLRNERQERVRDASGELSEKMRLLAEHRHRKEAEARAAAGHGAKTDAGPHAPPQCDTACDGDAETGAALSSANQTSHARCQNQGDGSMDGGFLRTGADGEGSSPPVPGPRGGEQPIGAVLGGMNFLGRPNASFPAGGGAP